MKKRLRSLIRPKHSTLPTLALLTRLLRRRHLLRRLFRLLRHVFVVFIVVVLFVIFFLLRALLLFSQRCRVASRTLRSRFLEVPIVWRTYELVFNIREIISCHIDVSFSLMHLVLIWISTLSVFLSFLNFPPVFSPAPCCVQCYACETVSLFCFCCVLLQLAACCFGFFFFLRCFFFLVFSFVLVRVLFVPCSVLCVLFFCEHFGFVVT